MISFKITVWVVESGMYSERGISGVYGSLQSAMDAHPTGGEMLGEWTQVGPLAWTNKLDLDSALTITGYDVESGEEPRDV